MSLSGIDKREFCLLHGWVGRRAFQLDRHDLCEAPEGSSLSETDDPTEEDEDADSDAETVEEEDEGEDSEAADSEAADEPVLDAGGSALGESDDEVWSRASARRRGIPPKKTLAVRRITRLELAAGQAELRALGADMPYERPRTRGDCSQVPRPCPYVACKYSLYLDVSATGSIILNFPHLEPGEMPTDRSCALDLAERGAMTLERIAKVTNLTRERIRQVELKALSRRALPTAIALGLGPEGVPKNGVRRQVETGREKSGSRGFEGTGAPTKLDHDE